MVYAATLPHIEEEKLFVVVSNNGRNRQLKNALAARITTTLKQPDISSIVPIDRDEPVNGRVCCDDIELLYPEDCRKSCGAFSQKMMRKIEGGLRAAFAIP
jgi:mRNA-degrading endonuclease toxin of MazEF toxin-antitoxin module